MIPQLYLCTSRDGRVQQPPRPQPGRVLSKLQREQTSSLKCDNFEQGSQLAWLKSIKIVSSEIASRGLFSLLALIAHLQRSLGCLWSWCTRRRRLVQILSHLEPCPLLSYMQSFVSSGSPKPGSQTRPKHICIFFSKFPWDLCQFIFSHRGPAGWWPRCGFGDYQVESNFETDSCHLYVFGGTT